MREWIASLPDWYDPISEGKSMPVRQIPKNYRNVTGLLASVKNGKLTAFESTLERDAYLLFDYDDSVKFYEEQPVIIPYFLNGEERTYTPDVLVVFDNYDGPKNHRPPMLAEIKYRQDFFNDFSKNRAKMRAARKYCKTRGWVYRVLTEKEVRGVYLKNIRFLRAYKHNIISQEYRLKLIRKLEELQETDPETLLSHIYSDKWMRAELIPALWHLVANGDIQADLHRQELTMTTRLWRPLP